MKKVILLFTLLALVFSVLPAQMVAYAQAGSWNNLGGRKLGVNGEVFATATAPDGSMYLGGYFSTGGGISAKNIVKWDGTAWSALGAGLNDKVYALTVAPDGTVYAAGIFTTAGGVPANRIAKWDGATWSALGTGMNAGAVYTLKTSADGTLYAGGYFTSAGGAGANYIAKWPGTAWSALGTGLNGNVYTIEIASNGTLYAGGSFSTAGGLAAINVAAWNGSQWSALGSGASDRVNSLAVAPDGSLVAGGNFVSIGGGTAYRIAKWNGSAWSALGTGMNAMVNAVAFGSNGMLYAGGIFTTAGSVAASRVAKWNGSSWSLMNGGLSDNVHSLSIAADGSLIAGGLFSASNVAPIFYAGRWNGADWLPIGMGINAKVNALTIGKDGALYAGGDFDFAGGQVSNHLARWSGNYNWAALGKGLENGTVNALAIAPNDDLYVGGDFTAAGGVPANRIARWNGSAWSALGAGLNNTVNALAFAPNGTLYVGGTFTTASGLPANRIARWNGSAWSALGTGMNGAVRALAYSADGNLFVGGVFTTAGGVTANRVAQWNGSAWSALGTGMNGDINALSIGLDGRLYAGGQYTTAGGQAMKNIAQWNGSVWTALGTGMNDAVLALATGADGALYAGGYFVNAGGLTATHIAKWDSSTWSALGAGLEDGYVYALSIDGGNTLYAAGDFGRSGTSNSYFVASYGLETVSLQLSSTVAAENQPIGSLVGVLSTTDSGGTYTYALASGAGATDNASFTISGSNLLTAAAFDYETKSSYSIRVRATDTGGTNTEMVLGILVADANEPPTALALSPSSVPENRGSGTTVGLLSASDPDGGDMIGYSLVDGVGAEDNTWFTTSDNSLRTTASFDYEGKPSYGIRVRATDAGGLYTETALVIAVTNINETPTDLSLSNTTVSENQAVGTSVGALTAMDPDLGDSFAFSLVSGAGAADNTSFSIEGDVLKTAAAFDFETKTSYSIRIRATDGGGLYTEKTVLVTILDLPEVTKAVSLDPSSSSVGEDGGVVIPVSLESALTNPVSVHWSAADGSAREGADFQASSGTLTFLPGETTKTISVQTVEDEEDEGDETFSLQLTNPQGAGLSLGSPSNLTITILDNDAPLMVGFTSDSQSTSERYAARITVSLNHAAAQTVWVNYFTGGETAVAGQDYTDVSGSVIFTAGQISKSFVVPVVNDSNQNGDRTVLVMLTTPHLVALGTAQAVLTIQDDETGSAFSANLPQTTANVPSNMAYDLALGRFSTSIQGIAQESRIEVSVVDSQEVPSPSNFSVSDASFFEVKLVDASNDQKVTFSEAMICLPYLDTMWQTRGITESQLRLMHYENGGWIDVTLVVDTTNNQICGKTTSFSPFAVLGETGTSGPGAAQIVLSAGALSVNDDAVDFGTVVLNGFVQQVAGSTGDWTVTDSRGAGTGWRVYLSAETFSDGSGHQIPLDGFTVAVIEPGDGSNIRTRAGNQAPRSAAATPQALTGPVRLLYANPDEGMGVYSYRPSLDLVLPPAVHVGSYRSILSLLAVNGPAE